MTKRQKLELRRSQIRERIRAISALEGDAVTDEVRAERDALTREYTESEAELRAAIIAEDEDTARRAAAADTPRDPESRDRQALETRASLSRYVNAALRGRDVDGAEAELRAAVFGADNAGATHGPNGGVLVPWAAIAPHGRERRDVRPAPESRQDVATALPATGIPTMARDWLGRVFEAGATMYLGVALDMVGVGEHTYPVLSAGESNIAPVAAGGDKDAAAATVSLTVLEPHRLTARYMLRVEDLARAGDAFEAALRADLSATLSESLDNQVLNGDGTAPNVEGIIAALTAPSDPGNVVTAVNVVSDLHTGVDGRYATNLPQVCLLLGTATYAKVGGEFLSGTDYTALDYAMVRAGGVRASALIAAAVSNIQAAIIARKGGDGRPNARAAVWEGLELVRDPYSRAGSGEVLLTAHMLFDFAVLRSAGFERLKYKIA